MFIAVSKNVSADHAKFPPNALKLASIFAAANIRYEWGNDEAIHEQDFYIAIGDAPAP